MGDGSSSLTRSTTSTGWAARRAMLVGSIEELNDQEKKRPRVNQ